MVSDTPKSHPPTDDIQVLYQISIIFMSARVCVYNLPFFRNDIIFKKLLINVNGVKTLKQKLWY